MKLITAYKLFKKSFIIKDTFLFTLGNVVTSIFAFFYWSLLSYFFEGTELGSGVSIVSIVSISVIVVVSGIDNAVIIKSEQNLKQLNLLYSSMIFYSSVFYIFEIVVIALLLLPALNLFEVTYLFNISKLPWVAFYGLNWVVLTYVSALYVQQKEMYAILSRDIVFSLTKILIILILQSTSSPLVDLVLHSFGMSILITNVVLIVFSTHFGIPQKIFIPNFSLKTIQLGKKFILTEQKFIFENYFSIISVNGQQYIFPLLIAFFVRDPIDVFSFYIAWKFISIPYMLGNNVGLSFLARNKDKQKDLYKFFRISGIVFCIFALLLFIFYYLISIVLPYLIFEEDLSRIVNIFFLLLLGLPCYLFTQLFALYERSFKNSIYYFSFNLALLIAPSVFVMIFKSLYFLLWGWVITNIILMTLIIFMKRDIILVLLKNLIYHFSW